MKPSSADRSPGTEIGSPASLESKDSMLEDHSDDHDASPAAGRRELLCPSAPPAKHSIVLGVVRPDGSVAYLRDRLPVDPALLTPTPDGRAPEQRLRFASPCQSAGCRQWVDGRCSVPERFSSVVAQEGHERRELPRCSIRADCRWFHQEGPSACRICPLVVTKGDHPGSGRVSRGD